MHWLAGFVFTLVYAMFAEYVSHRWLMHKPWPWRHSRYVEHAIEHHGKGRLDINIGLSPVTTMLAGLPLGAIWGMLLGVPGVLAFVLLCNAYAGWWSLLHAAHHNLGFGWLRRVPGYSRLREHHLLHHQKPHRNFGTVFPISDYFFRTMTKS